MSEFLIGWSPLSSLGEGVVGDIGSEFAVRLTDRYSIGLLTTNSDPEEVDIDPQTGLPAPMGTDVGFGAPLRRYIQTHIANGDFASAPSNTAQPIGPGNILPYWRFVPAASSNITATWVADATSASGGRLLWQTVGNGNGVDADDAYIEQLVPVVASHARAWSYLFNAHFGAASAVNNLIRYISVQYLRADGATTTGSLYANELTFATSDAWPFPLTPTPLANASRARVRVGIKRAVEDAALSGSVSLYDVWTEAGSSTLQVSDRADPATYEQGLITQSSGVVGVTPADISANPTLRVASGHVSVNATATGAALVVTSGEDEIIAIVRGSSTQTADVFVVENNSGTDLMAVDSAGVVWVGNDTAPTGVTPLNVVLSSDTSAGGNLVIRKAFTGSNGPNSVFLKARGSAASPTVVADDDALMTVAAYGWDGSTYVQSARIQAIVDGTPGASDMPSRLVFFTTPDNSITNAERTRIDSTGTLDHKFAFQLTNVISPAQLTANTDNWAPTGYGTCAVIRVSTDASRNLTGIVALTAGRRLELRNVGAQSLVLIHDATSTAVNRFYCPGAADFTLTQKSTVTLMYDGTDSRWYVES